MEQEDRKRKVIREIIRFRETKAKLEQDILNLVKEFEKETGRKVDNIKFSRNISFGDIGDTTPPECILSVSISIASRWRRTLDISEQAL